MRMMRVQNVALWGRRETDAGFLVGSRPLERPRHRWEDNIKMDLKEIGTECMGWICVTQDRDKWWAVVNTVMNLSFMGMITLTFFHAIKFTVQG
jgi:hypothetical protein